MRIWRDSATPELVDLKGRSKPLSYFEKHSKTTLVREVGLEPTRFSAIEPKSITAANYATPAWNYLLIKINDIDKSNSTNRSRTCILTVRELRPKPLVDSAILKFSFLSYIYII